MTDIETEESRRHPAHDLLESYAAGDANEAIAAHLTVCVQCKSTWTELRDALRAFQETVDPNRFVADVVQRAKAPPPSAWSAWSAWSTSSTGQRSGLIRALPRALPVLALAAGLVVWMRSPSRSVIPAGAELPTSAFEGIGSRSQERFEVRSKGTAGVAVVRDRQGHQMRVSGVVKVRAGDRLRVEMTQERSALCMALLLADDGSEVVLQPPQWLAAGVHFSAQAARFGPGIPGAPSAPSAPSDTSAPGYPDAPGDMGYQSYPGIGSGTLLVGDPEAVRLAVKSRRFDAVHAMRIQYE